ncbi:MAG: hypothetical protein HKN09_12665 [Saprospiraceae bacterium]|nr:hypothetical protein [Saprospiraceae bacterium]
MQPDRPHKVALISALKSNLNWINKSIHATNGNGSAAYRWSWGKWGPAYPETTGYLIPTLLRSSTVLRDSSLKDSAHHLALFLISIQNEDGSFPLQIKSKDINVFDCAQILLGLCCYYDQVKVEDVLKSIDQSLRWLIHQFDEHGQIKQYNLYQEYNPAYYLRILWPIFKALDILQLSFPEKLRAAFISLSQNIEKGYVHKASFKPGDAAYSHTIIYTIRGMIECERYIDQAAPNSADNFLRYWFYQILESKSFPGQVKHDGTVDYSFICTSGHLQLIICLLKKQTLFPASDLQIVVKSLFDPIYRSQKTMGFNVGGIPSSLPIYGKYQRFKYTNWTQKFYCDALMDIIGHYYL